MESWVGCSLLVIPGWAKEDGGGGFRACAGAGAGACVGSGAASTSAMAAFIAADIRNLVDLFGGAVLPASPS